jgi:hypothetical protein
MISSNPPLKWGFFILPLLFLLAGAAGAAQFSATMMIKDGGKLMPGKIFVQEGKLRQEFNDVEGQTITIVRPDLKVVWIILPQEQAYAELPLRGKLPGQFIQIPPDALSKRLVGQETVNGYEAEKYAVTVRTTGGPERQTVWLAVKLGAPVKMVSKERNFSIEYKGIKEEVQADRLFNLPPGFKKLDPAGFCDRVR